MAARSFSIAALLLALVSTGLLWRPHVSHALAGETPAAPGAGPLATRVDYCFDCHAVQEGMSLVFKDDIHYRHGLSCADCHGGDPHINDMNKSKLPATGFKHRATRQGIPEYCGRCHADADFMARYHPQQRTDQLALYTTGIHGRRLAAGETDSAHCGDCHGVHDTRAVTDPQSTVAPRQIVGTCGKCHETIAAAFRDSPHGPEFRRRDRPGCVTCHAPHATESATRAMLTGPRAVCTQCHKPDSAGAQTAAEMTRLLAGVRRLGPVSPDVRARVSQAIHTFDLPTVQRLAAVLLPPPTTGPTTGPTHAAPVPATLPVAATTQSAADCLSCHGPFSRLHDASLGYIAPSGEAVSPHRYVPHDSTRVEDIPECRNCHTGHTLSPLPPKWSLDLSRPGVQWCYQTCHHDNTLQSCKNCHP